MVELRGIEPLALAKHRWHWTLDETNDDRVSCRQYSRDVGRAESTIRQNAEGYDEWVRGHAHASDTPADLGEAMERAVMGDRRDAATEAVAEGR